jgi:hypothetical protein
VSVRQIAGVRRIAILGSIVTAKPDPKNIDVLVVVADDADLAGLATCSRRLQGHAQSFNRGADVFLADDRGTYIGRTCRWKECRPGVRRSCDALHCGRRPYLHDDLDAIRLNSTVVVSPPVTLWPSVERRGKLPQDVEEVVAALEHAVQHRMHQTALGDVRSAADDASSLGRRKQTFGGGDGYEARNGCPSDGRGPVWKRECCSGHQPDRL